MNKRGLSDVVVTVLIILIVIVAIGIISAIVLPLLRDSGKQVGTEKFTTNVEIIPKFTGGDGLCVIEFDINRPAGDGNITALRFVLTNTTGGTKTVDYPNAPTTPPFTFGQLEVKHIVLNCSPLNNVASVSVAPIFSNGVGIITDTRPVPTAVCGNGVVELGEQCEGTVGRCMIGPFIGNQVCVPTTCKLDPEEECNPNPHCSDGVDNDQDGKKDYPQDSGCVNLQDSDETRENIIVLRPTETEYNTLEFPYSMTVEFSIIDPEAPTSTASIVGGAQCWYKLDNGPEQSLGACNNYGLYPAQQIAIPSYTQPQRTITFGVRDNSPGVDSHQRTINFNLVQSSLRIDSPQEEQIVPTGSVPFSFTLGTGFNPTSCSYQIDEGPAQSFVCPSGSTGSGNILPPLNQEGRYSLLVSASRTLPAPPVIRQDIINFVVNNCPGDINGDLVRDQLDLNILLSVFGCVGACSPHQIINENPPPEFVTEWRCDNQPGVCNADINYNGIVDSIDTIKLVDRYGTTC